jgi:hypothetical protein
MDLPDHSVMMAGLDSWPNESRLEEIHENRLCHKLRVQTGVTSPRLYAPPVEKDPFASKPIGIGIIRFPLWFLVLEPFTKDISQIRSRRLVHGKNLDEKTGKFDGNRVVPIRFVAACPKGHIEDIDWRRFVHPEGDDCRRQLWLDETGTTGDLSDLTVRCDCGAKRQLLDATEIEARPLGTCRGKRPWISPDNSESCQDPLRLVIRTASNTYFPQVLSVLSIPERGEEIDKIVSELWGELEMVENENELKFCMKRENVRKLLEPYAEKEILTAIEKHREGGKTTDSVKKAELATLLSVPEGFGDDVPINQNFHARRLPKASWDKSPQTKLVANVIQVHRLRSVSALAGFTRLEPSMPDIHGEFETDVAVAQLAQDPSWFPAVENRGEGIMLILKNSAVENWLKVPAVAARSRELATGFQLWAEKRKAKIEFPQAPYVLLHTLSHLLIHSLALRCGYPGSSLRERIYVEDGHYGLLIYTASSDAEGTLGGLVSQARTIDQHLDYALRLGSLCSNDPICAHHAPSDSLEQRWLHGSACHGCVLISETSCEMRNDFLDRSLVVPTLGKEESAFFRLR